MASRRKAFHFDLDEERLKAVYPSVTPTGHKNAWKQIRSFMESHGFVHSQYSGYESKKGMSYYKAFGVIEDLQDAYPWFKECAQVATITEVGQRYDALQHLRERKEQEPETREAESHEEEKADSLKQPSLGKQRHACTKESEKFHGSHGNNEPQKGQER